MLAIGSTVLNWRQLMNRRNVFIAMSASTVLSVLFTNAAHASGFTKLDEITLSSTPIIRHGIAFDGTAW